MVQHAKDALALFLTADVLGLGDIQVAVSLMAPCASGAYPVVSAPISPRKYERYKTKP
jgi:hypothetical protein